MGTESDAIKRHIEARRDELGHQLNELEYRVKEATDWRRQYDRRPLTALAVAFGFGLALSWMSR